MTTRMAPRNRSRRPNGGATAGPPSPPLPLLVLSSLLLLVPPHADLGPRAVAANRALEELERPQAAHKVNIHAGWSSDDSSDDSEDSEDDEGCLKRNPDGSCQLYDNVQHFRNDFGELEFKWSSCDDPYDENHDDFETVAVEDSLYQKVQFEENLKMGDKCLRLDKTLQQCSSYRPHYHEPFVHLSAAYLNEGYLSQVTRVVFVGGGDSMLLHEILKYDHLELVLGLELDQKVTRNSFEHFKTQPHFDDPRVQWWFGDGAKSLTLLPRSYFGTFDLVLLDLSETVMSMTVTKGLDVFGAMKLLLSPTGILVKNDFGYFEKLAKVFDTCMQLLIPDVTYICDYELVLCSSDKVDFLNPSFEHLKGVREGKVDTLVYRPQDDIEDHWGPVTDYSKYWGEPRKCPDEGADVDPEAVAYAGVLMVVEAENISNPAINSSLEDPLKALGFNILSATEASKGTGTSLAIVMEEGYILAETWPDAKYCKLDIHLWGGFEKQEEVRAKLLEALGSAPGDWQSYRIVTGGVRGVDTRKRDLATVGPDLAKIFQCDPVEAGSVKAVKHDTSYGDHKAMRPIVDAGLDGIIPMMLGRGSTSLKAVVFCNLESDPCPAKDNLKKQGFTGLITLYQCPKETEDLMDSSPYERGMALSRWREAMKGDGTEFSLCGKKADVALKEISQKLRGINLVVADAVTHPDHVSGAHHYWLKFWKSIVKPFLLLVPILDNKDMVRTFFLKSRYNHAEELPEFYSEILVGDGKKTMSFGMIHEGTSTSLQNLIRAQTLLNQNPAVKFTDLRKVTLRGAMREQVNYDPVTFSWADYDQRPGLEQFYGQRPVGLESVFQLGLAPDAGAALSVAGVKKAWKVASKKWVGEGGAEKAFHEVGEGALGIALAPGAGHAAIVWDGADVLTVNVFTYDEGVDHYDAIVVPLLEALPPMALMLRDEQPRGYGKVINKSDRVNRDESPDCHDNYQMCPSLKKGGKCVGGQGAKEWMEEHCQFSCKLCDKENSYANAKDEL